MFQHTLKIFAVLSSRCRCCCLIISLSSFHFSSFGCLLPYPGEQDVLTQDHNLGLARQVRSALVRHNVRKLTSTYITLSLTDIAATAGLADVDATEALLRTMISSGRDIDPLPPSHLSHPRPPLTSLTLSSFLPPHPLSLLALNTLYNYNYNY